MPKYEFNEKRKLAYNKMIAAKERHLEEIRKNFTKSIVIGILSGENDNK